jgi:hypothetical protein
LTRIHSLGYRYSLPLLTRIHSLGYRYSLPLLTRIHSLGYRYSLPLLTRIHSLGYRYSLPLLTRIHSLGYRYSLPLLTRIHSLGYRYYLPSLDKYFAALLIRGSRFLKVEKRYEDLICWCNLKTNLLYTFSKNISLICEIENLSFYSSPEATILYRYTHKNFVFLELCQYGSQKIRLGAYPVPGIPKMITYSTLVTLKMKNDDMKK